MDAASSLTLRCVPRRSHLLVSSANQRSTRFIHDDEVGVKWKWTLGWLKSQRWMAGVLWVEELSNTMWIARPCGTALSMASRNFLNSMARCRAVSWWMRSEEHTSELQSL